MSCLAITRPRSVSARLALVLTLAVAAGSSPAQTPDRKSTHRASGSDLMIIDAGVSGADQLAAAALPGTEVLELDARQDALVQIVSALNAHPHVGTAHLISHGEPGALILGGRRVDAARFTQPEMVAAINHALGAEGELRLYGCQLAAGQAGSEFYRTVSGAIAPRLFASTDNTGDSAMGGNWTLEAGGASSSAATPFQAGFQYHGLLAPTVVFNDPSNPIYTRPGGNNFYWTYGLYQNSGLGVPNPTQITQVGYHNSTPNNYFLTRGSIQYASSTAGPWTTLSVPTDDATLVTTAGRVFRFVDTMPSDTTTSNNLASNWMIQGSGSSFGSGGSVIPDNPPTDVNTGTTAYWGTPAQGDVICALKNVDTGAPFSVGGLYSIDSQSVPNLFAISGGNLVKGTGTLPAVGTGATVTLRYRDLFQLNDDGSPMAGQGVTRTVTMTRRANPTGFSSDVQANTFTTNAQTNPAVAGLSDGSYVVAWRSTGQDGETTSFSGVYAQRFTAAGVKSGSEFPISPAGDGILQTSPVIAALANGRFVVAYQQSNTDTDIIFRIVEADGTLGAATFAPSTNTGGQTVPAITSLSDGGFAIAWIGPNGADTGDVWVRKFTSAGAPVSGSELVVNTTQTGSQTIPGVAGLSDGNYAVSWRDSANLGDVYCRIMGPSGAVSSQIAVSTDAFAATNPRIAALTGGGFVVAYSETGRTEGGVVDTSSQANIYACRYNNAGTAQGGEFLVNAGVFGSQVTPAITGLSGGGFLIGWVGNTDPDDSTGLYGRRFDSSGSAVDDYEFQLNERRTDAQSLPVLGKLGNNGFAAAWADATLDGNSTAVAARSFSAAAPVPNLSINAVTLNEGNAGTTSFTFTVSLSSPAPAGGVTFDIATADGTAVAPGDYTAKSLTSQTIPQGSSSYSFTVLVNGDTTSEANETFFVNVTNVTNATVTDGQGLGTITNDDAAPSLSIDSPTVSEGNSGNTTATFTVSLSAASGQTVTVNYATANGTATAGEDYTATSGTLTFSPGQTTKTVSVTVLGDTKYETDETFVVNLTGSTNATIATAQGTGTITNDDSLPVLSISSPTVTEGNSGTTNATFTVSLSNPSYQTITVNYATADGTATTGDNDYVAASGTLTFSPGQTSQTFNVTVNGDTKYEPNETFTATLTIPTNATIGTATGTATITNDDTAPALSIGSVSQSEGNSGTTAFTFTVSLSTPAGQTVTVNYATANGTAVAGEDYTATSGTLTFAPGVTTQTITVQVIGDTKFEANETFSVNLSSPTNAVIGTGTGTGTIVNDDTAPTLSIDSPAAVAEGNSGTTPVTFTVTLSAISGQTTTVNYATADGTGSAGEDYTATSGTLTFAPGETSKTITVLVNGDTKNEADETFLVNLSSPTNATITTSQGTGTILNDDAVPTLSLNSPSVNEGNSGTTVLTFTATLSAASGQTVTVNYATADGTATAADNDYIATSGTLTFAPGQTTKTFNVTINGDTRNEADETFTATLTTPVNATIATGTGTGTITNDDPLPTLSINNPAPVTEGDSGTKTITFTASLSAASGRTVAVNYTTADGTATTADNDYIATSGTLTFAPGQTTKTFTVTINGDTKNEADETFTATLSGATNATITTATGTATITNDDPVPSLSINTPVAVAEGNSGTKTVTFTATLSAVSGQTVTVNYATADGTATAADGDYVATSGTLTFAPGDTTKTFNVTINGDTKNEADETFTATLGTPVNATITTATGTATILNDDSPPTLSINTPASVTEGNSGTTTVTFTATLSAISGQTVAVNYATADGTATTADSDYVAASGTLTFAPGQTTRTFSVTINGDAKVEPDETFTATLANPVNATIATATGTATITNDDTATVSVAKLNDGAESNTPTNGAFRITQSAVSSTDTVVNFSVTGTATSGSDFTALPANTKIPAGLLSVDVPVVVLNDNIIEPTETVTITLDSLGLHNAGISIAANPSNTATLNITDNDVPTGVTVNSGSNQSAAVGTAFATPLVVVVKDSGGVPLQGASVTFTAPGSGASGTFASSATVTTNASGLATAPTFTANSASGSYSVSASVPGVQVPATFSLTNTAGPATHYTVSAPGTAIAGVPVDVSVTALDQFNNTSTTYGGTVHLTSSDGAAVLPANSGLTSGVKTFSVSFSTGGNQTVTATDTASSITGVSGTVVVSPRADLAVTLEATPDPVNALGTITYTIGLTNNGPSASVAPSVSLPLPAGTTFVSSTMPGDWSVAAPAVAANGTVTFNASSLASAGTAGFTVVAKVNIDVVNNSQLSTTATATETTTDPASGNNTASSSVTAKSGADLVPSLAAAPEPVVAGTNLTYTIGVKNNGPLDSQNAALSLTLPTGTTFVSLDTNSGWSATTPAVGSGGLVTISHPLFANGGNVSFPLVVKVGSNVANGSVLTASLTAGATTVDIVPGNNTVPAASNVITRSDIGIELSGTPTTAPKDSNVTYAIVLTNHGPSDAVNPVVSFPIPAQMTFVSASGPEGWIPNAPAVGSGGTVTFSATGLANAAVANFTVVAKVRTTAPNGTVITATATASASGTDTVSINDSASTNASVGTTAPTPAQLTTTSTLNKQNGLFELTVNVSNTTPLPINGFRLHVDYTAYLAAYPSLKLYAPSSPGGSPDVYVDYPYPVPVDGVVPVKLSFYTSTRTFPNPFAPVLTVESLATSAVSGTDGAGVQPVLTRLTDGTVMLEFPSVTGHWYRVRYSADLTNWFDSPIPIRAGGSRTQWIDSGAPFTISSPAGAPSRFYRVNEIGAP